ncbi:hypothetical protein H5P27_05480 [Pelagicoccus albus]|uniref:Uncharacterized protein n=1 Tax=Pelagicoccus albus TaxID=415222 RepID=A0A7X1B6W2_9BACT|nr:hypothetical protein [Pelagicoccus albus]MBC2605488.1 hypothetical protein [Pelagicoccus albus]
MISPSLEDSEASPRTVEKTHRVSAALLSSQFSRKLEELPTFVIEVENHGERSLIFTTSSVKLSSGDQPVEAYSIEEYTAKLAEASHREAEEEGGRQAEAALRTSGSVSTPAMQDNSAAMAKITSANMASRASANRKVSQQLNKEITELIDIHQINPGDSKSGKVLFHGENIKANLPLKLVVTLEGEPYEFTFSVTEQSQ